MIVVYFLILISSVISGFGVGGGSVFLLVNSLLGKIEHKEAMIYSLIMFIAVGISNTIKNSRDKKKFNKKIFFKLIFFVIIGSVIGSYITRSLSEINLKKYFNVFMLFIGIYEIISSLLTIRNAQNITKERS